MVTTAKGLAIRKVIDPDGEERYGSDLNTIGLLFSENERQRGPTEASPTSLMLRVAPGMHSVSA